MQRQLSIQQPQGKWLEVSAMLQCQQEICDYENRQSSSQALEQSTIYVNTCSRSMFWTDGHGSAVQCSSNTQRNKSLFEPVPTSGRSHTYPVHFERTQYTLALTKLVIIFSNNYKSVAGLNLTCCEQIANYAAIFTSPYQLSIVNTIRHLFLTDCSQHNHTEFCTSSYFNQTPSED